MSLKVRQQQVHDNLITPEWYLALIYVGIDITVCQQASFVAFKSV